MISPGNCTGPRRWAADGCWYCPAWPEDDTFDCDQCQAEVQEMADRENDMEAE